MEIGHRGHACPHNGPTSEANLPLLSYSSKRKTCHFVESTYVVGLERMLDLSKKVVLSRKQNCFRLIMCFFLSYPRKPLHTVRIDGGIGTPINRHPVVIKVGRVGRKHVLLQAPVRSIMSHPLHFQVALFVLVHHILLCQNHRVRVVVER